MILTAISPRLAISTFENMAAALYRPAAGEPICPGGMFASGEGSLRR
jgi:hypothetical protein